MRYVGRDMSDRIVAKVFDAAVAAKKQCGEVDQSSAEMCLSVVGTLFSLTYWPLPASAMRFFM